MHYFLHFLIGCSVLAVRSGQLDLRFWWGSPRPRSTSAGPTEAPCAPSVCVTGEKQFTSMFISHKLSATAQLSKLLMGKVGLTYFACVTRLFFSGSSVLSWLRSRRSSSRCWRRRHRARNRSKMCICIATIKKDKQIHFLVICIDLGFSHWRSIKALSD